MRVIPRRTPYASSHYSLDNPAKASDLNKFGVNSRGCALPRLRSAHVKLVEQVPDPWLLINKQRKHRLDQKGVRLFLSALVPELGLKDRPFSVVFIPDDVIRRYNRQYRGFDKPTDVLSFRGDHGYLGDILISTETAYNQAQKSKTLGFDQNLRRLVLHGLLHLMGYDHETDDGQMRVLERRLRRRFQC